MRITPDQAKALCGDHLAAQRFFSQLSEEGADKLAGALANAARSQSHAVEILRGWTRTEQEMPTPADMFRLAESVPDPEAREVTPWCPHCGGSGWQIVERSDGVSGAKRCICAAVSTEAA